MSTLSNALGAHWSAALGERLARRAFALEDTLFERWNGLDLGGVIAPADLADAADGARTHATSYQAVWCRNVRELLREAGRTGVPLKTFVDLGSGKGKACFYAAQRARFDSIVGVEFSRPLVDIAERNARHLGNPSGLRFVHTDASTYTLPAHNCLVFMFNPFDHVVLGRFLEHNRPHFAQHDSLLAYANDVQLRELARHGFEVVFRNQARRTSLHRRPRP